MSQSRRIEEEAQLPQDFPLTSLIHQIKSHEHFERFFHDILEIDEKNIKRHQTENMWKGIFNCFSDDYFAILPPQFINLWKKKEKAFPKSFQYALSVFFNKFNLQDAQALLENYVEKQNLGELKGLNKRLQECEIEINQEPEPEILAEIQ